MPSYRKLNIMAEILNSSRAGKSIARQLKVDMTPMVDLGFLLITFFIFTTAMETPQTLKLVLPVDGDDTPTARSKTLTLLLHEPGRAACYEGAAGEMPVLQYADMDAGNLGLRNIIMAKQQRLRTLSGTADSMIVIIKPGPESNYRQLIAALDEMTICEVKRHVVAAMDNDDQLLVSSQ